MPWRVEQFVASQVSCFSILSLYLKQVAKSDRQYSPAFIFEKQIDKHIDKYIDKQVDENKNTNKIF